MDERRGKMAEGKRYQIVFMCNFKQIFFKIFGLIGLSIFIASSLLAADKSVDVTKVGAVGNGSTLNTIALQKAIDDCAGRGGCTLVFPRGIFLTGAIFLKKGVNLRLEEGAVIKGSTDRKDYPKMKTRVEGHFPEWLPAVINADKVDNLKISGAGVFDGSGAPFWADFWARRKENPKTTNLDVERPRLMLIQNSKNVRISGVKFKDSGFWNLHIYNCQNVTVENAKFEIPDGVRAPSTDGIDIDSSQNVTIRGCTFRVDDDSVCLKGSKGPFAMDDKLSPPVENIRIVDCIFERGHGVVTLGSEATIVRNVTVEHIKVVGPISLVRLKLRPDTPQFYENIHYRNITLENSEGGALLQVRPWSQFFDLKGQTPPNSTVKNVTLENVKGTFGALGEIFGTQGQTTIDGITLKNIDVQLKNAELKAVGVKNLQIRNVKVNGKSFALTP